MWWIWLLIIGAPVVLGVIALAPVWLPYVVMDDDFPGDER